MKQNAIAVGALNQLQEELNAQEVALGRPAHWYYDYIQGALSAGDGTPPPPTKPFNTAGDIVWDRGHHEGYAVFWRQNIAKFGVIRAPRIQPPGANPFPNSQSRQTLCPGAAGPVPVGGMPVPAGGITVPAGPNSYLVSPGNFLPGGTALPANTVIGPQGLRLNAQTNGVNPIVIPGGYNFGADTYTLPLAGTVVVPRHVLSLVLFGRRTADPNHQNRPIRAVDDISDVAANFVPGGATPWDWLEFTRSNNGSAERVLARRPAYLTIDVNRGGGAAARLVPIIVYHAPSTGQAAISGMQRSAYSQPMYQAFDWTAAGGGAWIDCNNAVIGADFNVENRGGYAYRAFTNGFGQAGLFGGGAAATQLIAYPVGNFHPDDVRNQSLVAINRGWKGRGPPIYQANLAAYRNYSIDNIFYRGLANVQMLRGGVFDLLDSVTGGGGGAPAVAQGAIQNFCNLPNMITILGGGHANLPLMVDQTSSLLDMLWGQFRTGIAFGNNNGQRRAAEFVRLFVSDHLPIGIQFTM